MESTVTLTLKEYHEILDSRHELNSFALGEIKLTVTNYTYNGSEFKVEFLKETKAIEEIKELIIDSDRFYRNEYSIINSQKRNVEMQLNQRENELDEIKKHWAYKLFIK